MTTQLSAIPPALQRAAQHWPGLSCIVQVVRQRQMGDAPASVQESYYLSSLPAHTPAHVLAHSIRAHWSVENNLHWSLDVAMREDAAQTSKDRAPQNYSLIRSMALQLLQSDKSARIGVQARRKRAGWDLKYLKRLIHQEN